MKIGYSGHAYSYTVYGLDEWGVIHSKATGDTFATALVQLRSDHPATKDLVDKILKGEAVAFRVKGEDQT